MRKQKLFVDFDDTLVNSTKRFVEIYNKITGEKADWTKVRQWNFNDQCPNIDDKYIHKVFAMTDFFEDLELYDQDTLTVFNKLKEKYEVIIATIGTPLNVAKKAIWIADNLAHHDMLLLSQNHSIMSKAIVDMTGGILIDDHENNLITSSAETNISFGTRKDYNINWKGPICLNWAEIGSTLL